MTKEARPRVIPCHIASKHFYGDTRSLDYSSYGVCKHVRKKHTQHRNEETQGLGFRKGLIPMEGNLALSLAKVARFQHLRYSRCVALTLIFEIALWGEVITLPRVWGNKLPGKGQTLPELTKADHLSQLLACCHASSPQSPCTVLRK